MFSIINVYPAHRETVIAGEDQVQRLAIGAHPLGGKAAGFPGPDVPGFGEVRRGPGPPRLRGVIDAEPAAKSRVAAGQDLAPEVPLQARIVADPGSIARPSCVKTAPRRAMSAVQDGRFSASRPAKNW